MPAVPPPRPRRERLSRGGFTLIELLISVAIMATLLIVAVKVSQSLAPENELDAAARDLSTSIEYARSEAIVSGRRVFFEFALGDGRNGAQAYRSIREPLPGHEKDQEDDQYLLTVRDWKSLPDGVRVESIMLGETDPIQTDNLSVTIQPDGTMPSHLIRLWSPQLDSDRRHASGWVCIQVSGLLGQARVLNRYVEPEFLREDSFQ